MKNGKVAGPDGILAEALNADVNTSVEMLYSLFEEIWKKKKFQQNGKKVTLSRFPRKET